MNWVEERNRGIEEEVDRYIRYIMDSFGEWIKNDEKLFREVIDIADFKYGFKNMDKVRTMLREKGHDVPFRWDYRERTR
jgi:hypothetical protein